MKLGGKKFRALGAAHKRPASPSLESLRAKAIDAAARETQRNTSAPLSAPVDSGIYTCTAVLLAACLLSD